MKAERSVVRWWLAVAGAVTGFSLVATAAAVPIQGALQVPRDYSPPTEEAEDAPAPYYWEEWNGVLDPRDPGLDVGRALAVVLLGHAEGDAPDAEFELRGGDLFPSTMVANANSTLEIANTDACSHELFSESLEELGPLQTAPGNARTAQLPGPGHHVIRDRIYPHVEGHLHLVSDLVARAGLSDDGQFVFEDVPPGNYQLKVFHLERELVSMPVEVTDSRLTLDPIEINLQAAGQ